ncbi:hypothetical protein ASPBRDRAFT_228812 [Aspergillus brasiliensis CBS 101740]|uniref:Uncharacterized protein n=1 Tax=Aspergillus brasiliensis (strain CBS 101740 / IMI 381727 / IBT 21946) TaxID=767769 RepID=A0A1L9UZR6_ASPBC|nr:hypothetical protein ASPBRDRAFT_228812 [Aspergillus brasiliensis CBS 101740]
MPDRINPKIRGSSRPLIHDLTSPDHVIRSAAPDATRLNSQRVQIERLLDWARGKEAASCVSWNGSGKDMCGSGGFSLRTTFGKGRKELREGEV